jgi:Tol biopolymer transport system component
MMMLSILSGVVLAQGQVTFELSKIRAKNLKKLSEEVEPIAFPDVPKKVNSEITSPDKRKIVKLIKKSTGLESASYQIYVTLLKSCQKYFIAEAVNCYGLGWSPDSSKIAFSEGTLVHLADSDGSSQQMIYTGPGGPYPGACFDFAWSRDGRRLSFIQVESVRDSSLAHPKRITLLLGE